MNDLQVGQTLYFVGRDRYHGPARDVTVTKIGRKWASLDNGYRISLESLYADGGQYASPGRCWPNREAYEAALYRAHKWSALRKWLDHKYSPPEGVTVEQMQQAAKLLGLGEGAS